MVSDEEGVTLGTYFVNCAQPITTETSSCTMRSMTLPERCEQGEIGSDDHAAIARCRELGYEYIG